MFVTRIHFHLKRYVRNKHSLSFKTLVMFVMRILFHLKRSYYSQRAISFIQNVRNVRDTRIILHSAPRTNYYVLLFIYIQRSSFMYLEDKYKRNRNVINSCYYGKMSNVTKQILLSNLSLFENETIFS